MSWTPACGCGNFLYVAYRELRSLEAQLKSRIRALADETGLPVPSLPWPYVPLTNMQGIDIEGTAVLIARVVLWMGHRQMIEMYGEAEPPLPLIALDGVRRDDALRATWPQTDCIIGNPPFLGDRRIRAALGDVQAAWLKREFGVGLVDFSAYWFRRAVEHLEPNQRAGLVSTNTLRETKHRRASLDYVVDSGVITDAVSTQLWPGEAKVHVSITNWIKGPSMPPSTYSLDGVLVSGITSSLRAGQQEAEPGKLVRNRDRAFIGCYTRHKGFEPSTDEATAFLADERNRGVVRPFLNGQDLSDRPSQDSARWVIDFGIRPLQDAAKWPDLLDVVRARVRPDRQADPQQDKSWWLFWRPRPEMRSAIGGSKRFAAALGTGKRLLITWQDVRVCPSHGIVVFAFEDDYSMGVLQSRAHGSWAWAHASTLKGDLRYTPTSVFATFPWPDPTAEGQRDQVADICRRLLARRTEICQQEQIGLTKLYNAVDDGAWADLKTLHRELDVAVAACYGWPAAVAQDDAELVRRLTERNREITAGSRAYDPFAHLESAPPA